MKEFLFIVVEVCVLCDLHQCPVSACLPDILGLSLKAEVSLSVVPWKCSARTDSM